MRIKIKKGLDLPIAGTPQQAVTGSPTVHKVALLGADYVGMKPTMLVKPGQQVKKGQALFEDKKTPGVIYTATASGRITDIHRGAKRALLSVVIEKQGDDEITFEHWSREDLEILSSTQVRDVLLASGLWTALRTRPYSKVPAPDSRPHSIFVTAIDTSPLAADPSVVAADKMQAFADGLQVLSRLTSQPIFVCQKPGANFPGEHIENVKHVEFEGPHPAGLVGTHIHFLDPVNANKTVWHINYQDVIAVGMLFTTGHLYTERVVSCAGPQVKSPCLIRTELGASISECLSDHTLKNGDHRIISGSVLQGHRAIDATDFLGRYQQQISVIAEDHQRIMLHYVRPGLDKPSVLNVLFSCLRKQRKFDMTTSTNGSPRAMVPVGYYERLMPMDILPTQLLRALVTTDTDLAQQLGALELDEEDLALCTYVSSSKIDYGPALRRCLTKIEKEG